MYQLKITVEETSPPICRTIQIPETYSLNKLHHIIQICFGWENSHIWCFLQDDVPTTNPMLWGGGTTKWDEQVRINTVLKKEGDTIPYEYGRGIGTWKLSIRLEQLDVEGVKAPRCLDGARAVPEDVGGAEGYHNLIYRLNHPEIDGYLGILNRLGDDFDINKYNIRLVNKQLKGLARYIRAFEEKNDLLRYR